MGYAVSAKPIAATLEKLFVGQRSGVRPLRGSVVSQNQWNVRCSSVSRNAVCLAVSADGGVGPLIPVTDGAVVHAERQAGNNRGASQHQPDVRHGIPC